MGLSNVRYYFIIKYFHVLLKSPITPAFCNFILLVFRGMC